MKTVKKYSGYFFFNTGYSSIYSSGSQSGSHGPNLGVTQNLHGKLKNKNKYIILKKSYYY